MAYVVASLSVIKARRGRYKLGKEKKMSPYLCLYMEIVARCIMMC